jgi:hypothetical protein
MAKDHTVELIDRQRPNARVNVRLSRRAMPDADELELLQRSRDGGAP